MYPERPLVIIPTYKERENIEHIVPAVLDIDSRLHVLIVDDASPDDTAGVVRNLQKGKRAERLFLISRSAKLGLGNAYVHGFTWGIGKGYEFLIQMDADWSHPPKYVSTMLQQAGKYDFVVGSRYMPGGGTLHWGTGRRILSQFGTWYSRAILKSRFTDFTGGFNGWSARVLSAVGLSTLKSNGYGFQIELKYRADKLGFRHLDFPFVFDERRAGRSKMSASIALEAFWRVWQVRWMNSGFVAAKPEVRNSRNSVVPS
jgi:dolichol-phosphate mannosyltransferase